MSVAVADAHLGCVTRRTGKIAASNVTSRFRPKINDFQISMRDYDRGRSIYHSNQQSCEDQCVLDAGCAGYTINLTKRICILKKAIGL